MYNKKLPLYIDAVFGALLLPIMIMLLPIDRWIAGNPLFAVSFIIWLYAVYFLNRLVIIPMMFGRKKYMAGILIIIAMFAVSCLLINVKFSFHGSFHNHEHVRELRFVPRMRMREQGMWFLFFVVMCFSFAVGLFTELARQIMRSRELEVQRDKAELSLYKAQINPHFLFNTLNSLYGLLITGSQKSEEAFMQFIDMLKYMYSNGDKEKLPVCDEAEYIKQYIELQKLRLNEHTTVNFECVNTENEKRTIASMLLITFIENAFKYGVSSHEDSVIDISLKVDGNILYFMSSNVIMKRDTGKGMGIPNCRKRLELLYKGRHELVIAERENRFIVSLSVELD